MNGHKGLAFTAVTTAASPATIPHLVVGYDGSPPARRALDAAILLLYGRTGRIDVVYVVHTPVVADAPVAPADVGLAQIEQELRAMAAEQLGDRGVAWGFERCVGNTAHELTAAATGIGDTNPDRFVAIVVGSSSHVGHRMVGSVAVSLARHSPVPLVIVP